MVSPLSPAAQVAPSPANSKSAISPELAGRTVEAVRIVGNQQVPTAVILNVVRTREGDKFNPAAVEEDYQRIFNLKRFANVEAKVEPTATGVIVVFAVAEQKQIKALAFQGNKAVDTDTLQEAVDLKPGQVIDRFRIALVRQSLERLYRDKNFPFAHVEVPPEPLAEKGELKFLITEGPEVRIRKVDFRGNRSFTADRLKDQIHTAFWIWIFRPGTFDPDQVDDDVASLRRFYEGKGFFDVRVGRKLSYSPEMKELQVTFVIEEGTRYKIDRISFKGNASVAEAKLREKLKLLEGATWDRDVLDRDVREIVRAYSPFGYIYQASPVPPALPNPDYLQIDTSPVFRREAGKVELVYQIHEGKPFHTGRILVKGNAKTQDKVILREMRVAPGQLYNSAEINDAADRLKGTPLFQNVNITPVGNDPQTRDVLVEVTESKTAVFNIGAGVNSNGGVAGNITYEQRNFDIANWPTSWRDVFSEKSFTGAGQTFRASFEPGTQQTNADIYFAEPWLFDQPYTFSNDLYLRQRHREDWDEDRLGDRVVFGKRLDNVWTLSLALRAEDISINDINDPELRAPEIVESEGHHFLTSAGPSIRRDTTNHGPVPFRGTNTVLGWEHAGALGGEYNFDKFTLGWDGYITVNEDLLDRKTVLGLHLDSGYISGDAPFFERFYGGGIGSVRGFRYRGISPRAGLGEDPIGGNFVTTGTAELSFPIAGDTLRGVVFSDAGTVESEFGVGTIRSSVGTGIRLILPFLGRAPLSLDFALPVTKASQDETQFISFSFGFVQ